MRLTALQRLFFAVGFHLHRGGAVFCVDKQDVQQAHGTDGSCLGRSRGWGHRRTWMDGLQQKAAGRSPGLSWPDHSDARSFGGL